MDTEMKLALSGVDLKEPDRVALAVASPIGRAQNLLLRASDRGDTGPDDGLGRLFQPVPSPPAQWKENNGNRQCVCVVLTAC